ncbi:unnamed protein product [Rotaria magnacalcarata]|uniref:Uncharacterized protein n=1 Tax=Rotaria magnacalcarata TaxID=392030 RepID=A0A818WIB2_9BILA|nr:unnamed protein product [Rotaria magnacalcarata]
MLSRFISRAVFQIASARLVIPTIPHRLQSSTSNSKANNQQISSSSAVKEVHENESFLNNRDTAQAIADEETIDSVEQATSTRAEMISLAMKNYLMKSREKQKVLDEKNYEFEIGRRHLARIMGEDPEGFNQEKIDACQLLNDIYFLLFTNILGRIELFASIGLTRRTCSTKDETVQFDKAGRPFHFLYYTAKQNYYDVLHMVANRIEELKKAEVALLASGLEPDYSQNDEFNYTQWESKEIFEQRFLEKLNDEQYKTLITCLNRLVKNPMAYTIKDYINSFRTKLADTISKQHIEPVKKKFL